MLFIAVSAYKYWSRCLFLIFFLALTGCALQRQNVAVAEYDFGPGALQNAPELTRATLAPLTLEPVQANAALDSSAVLFRLLYADAQQPRPYALARWRMLPAQLVEQRLRAQLGLHRAVLVPGEIVLTRPTHASANTPVSAPVMVEAPLLSLRVELEEFSQLFAAPNQSSALIRLRATLRQHGAGDTLLAQRSFVAQQKAVTSDARGGVQALTAATDQVIAELEGWLNRTAVQHPPN